MAFPTTPIVDSFNRANEGPPPSADWIADALAVVDNSCAALVGSLSAGTYLPRAGLVDEVYLTTRDDYTDVATEFTVLARIQDAADPLANCYGLIAIPGETPVLQLFKGDVTIWILDTLPVAWEPGDGFGLEVITSGEHVIVNAHHLPAGGAWTQIQTLTFDLVDGYAHGSIGLALETSDPTEGVIAEFGGGAAPNSNPTGLVATAMTEERVDLTWDAAAPDVTGFDLERAQYGGGWGVIATLPSTTEAWSDTGLTYDTLYAWRLRAFNTIISLGYSADVPARTNAFYSGVTFGAFKLTE